VRAHARLCAHVWRGSNFSSGEEFKTVDNELPTSFSMMKTNYKNKRIHKYAAGTSASSEVKSLNVAVMQSKSRRGQPSS